MPFDWKKALRALLSTAAILGFFGFLLTLLFALAVLSGQPLFWVYPLFAFGAAAILALALSVSGYLGPTAQRRLKWGLLAVLGMCLLIGGWGAYQDRIPTVDDRALLLWQYEPFAPDGKAARLEEPATLRLEGPRLPRLDGATALYPVYAAFVQAVYPEGSYPLDKAGGPGQVACSNTVNAYQRLLLGETDLIFAAAPSQEQLDDAARRKMEFQLTPIGREAFVFFVNSKNPVETLTVAQIQGIYTGEITRWIQVGGSHRAIRPFQRAENSGSQTALRRLMGDLPLLEPETEDRVGAMDGIIRQVARYRNHRNAIGFSFRFYATEMVSSSQIRLLSLNGVAPTRETIRNGSYPISSEFYAVTAAPIGQPPREASNPDLAAFLAWVLSDQGQALVDATGYVSLS